MIIVTGGLGFIGNELVRQLKREGAEVLIIDNRNRVAPDIEDIMDVPIEYVDIVDYNTISAIFQKVRPTTVYHLAAIHFIPECNENPERTLRVNVEGTQSVLRAAVSSGTRQFFFASSGAVYADSPHSLKEEDKIAPVDIYGYSKLFGEQLCVWYAKEGNLQVAICRIFNNYGPRETNLHIVPEIIKQMKQGDKLQLGNIKPIRDYIHTKDTARAMILLADKIKGNLTTVNLTNGEGYSVEDLIAMFRIHTGRDLVYLKDSSRYRKVDKSIQTGNVSYLKELTGWEPQIKMEEGLRELLKYEGLITHPQKPVNTKV